MHFRYRALDSRQRCVSGEREARSLAHLEQELERQGLELINAKPRRLSRPARMSRGELADFCQQVEQLLAAGIPMMEALDDLAATTDGRAGLPALCRRLGDRLAAGLALSQALAEEGLDPACVGVIRAGEYSGRLPESLRRLGESLQRSEEQARTTKKILLQPLLAGIMVSAAGIFLMLYLVPQIRNFLADSSQPLPLASILLFATADFLQGHWPWLGVPPLLLLAAAGMRHHPALTPEIDRLSLCIPVTGPILRKLLTARLAELLALLYGSGIPLLEALRSIPAAIGNRSTANIVRQIADEVEQGSGLAEAFSRHDFFPPLLIRILHAGERSGTLDQALQHIGRRCEREAGDAIATLQTLAGPTLTLLIGLLLGWIMLATIQPLYGLIDGGMP